MSRSRPGNTTAPCGSWAMAASRSRVAGCEPVEPAAITGVAGGCSRQRAAWARIARVRRSMASIWPRSASTLGQASPTMARKVSVRCQWLAKLPSTRPSSWLNDTPSMASSSSSRPSSRASLSACAADWAMGWPSSSLKAATSCASSASRSAGSMAGGRASALPSPAATSHSLSSRSPSGAIRGSRVGLPSDARRKASRNARTERRVGSRISTSASASGSPPCSASTPAASSSAKRRSMPMVNTPFMPARVRLRRGPGACRYGTSRRR